MFVQLKRQIIQFIVFFSLNMHFISSFKVLQRKLFPTKIKIQFEQRAAENLKAQGWLKRPKAVTNLSEP